MNPKDRDLVDKFVATFTKLDDSRANEVLAPIGWQFAIGEPDEFGQKIWRPIKQETDRVHLDAVYSILPARFPPLYEELVLSYRWPDVDLRLFTLFANPLGADLRQFQKRMSADKYMYDFLIRSGYIPFGRGTDIDHDHVCFELKSRRQNAEFRVVKIDHEEILCFDRLKVVGELAPTFRQLMITTIELADKSNG